MKLKKQQERLLIKQQLEIEAVYHKEIQRIKDTFQLTRLKKACKSDDKMIEAIEVLVEMIQGETVPQSSLAGRLGKRLNKLWGLKLISRKQFLLGAKIVESCVDANILKSETTNNYDTKMRCMKKIRQCCLNAQVNSEALRKPLMVCEPQDYEDFQSMTGGYLSIHTDRCVHNSHSNQKTNDVLASINRVQKKPLAIDKYMLKVQEHLIRNTEIEKFNDTKMYRRLSTAKLEEAARYKAFDAVYMPYYVDYRSRLYPEPFLSYQGSDAVKSLFCSPKKVQITKSNYKHVLFSVANCLGCDKEDMEDRLEFAGAKETQCVEFIEALNRDLVEGTTTACKLDIFKQALEEELFCFIQSAKAVYEHYKGSNTTDLMPAFDATCSAVQLTALAYRDRLLAEEVNVVDTGTRKDIYASVAETVGCTRNQAKKPVGFYTYGITVNNVINERIEAETGLLKERDRVKELRQKQSEEGVCKDDLTSFSYKDWYEGSVEAQTIAEQVKNCFNIMKTDSRYKTLVQLRTDIGQIVRAKDKANESHTFLSPLGFEVANDTYKPKFDIKPHPTDPKKTVKEFYYERVKISYTDKETGKKTVKEYKRPLMSPNISNASKSMANFVHMLDATLIHKVNLAMEESVLFIHDSMACDIDTCDKMLYTIKEQTVDIFKDNVLELVGITTELGDLDPREVMKSEYYFS